MRIVKKVIVPAMPRELLFTLIEFISEAMVKDAKDRFGNAYRFKTHIRKIGNSAIETYVQFFPYKYDFIWKITPDKLGSEIELDARTAGRWTGALFGMDGKLEKLADTQWAALVNFCHGYLTAAVRRPQKGHIEKSRKKLREK